MLSEKGDNLVSNKSSPHGIALFERAISSRTLRTQDLLRSFADEHEALVPFRSKNLVAEARDYANMLDLEFHSAMLEETLRTAADEILKEVMDELEDIAAKEGYIFGTQEGDGACFGFWKEEEGEEEVL